MWPILVPIHPRFRPRFSRLSLKHVGPHLSDKIVIGSPQVVASRRLRGLRTQEASAPDGRGDVELLAIAGLMMLVGQQMRRQLGLADGGPYDAEATQGAFPAIPSHVGRAEDTGQGPERDAEFAQEQRPLGLPVADGPKTTLRRPARITFPATR